MRLISLMILFLVPATAFAAGQQPQNTEAKGKMPTLDGCFRVLDAGARSGCIMEVAVHEKDFLLCDLVEIPGMVRDCLNGVAAVTTIPADRCRAMNETSWNACLAVADGKSVTP